jgi:hypothetical protein
VHINSVIILAFTFLLCNFLPLIAYGDCDYYLYKPVKFTDGILQGCVRKNEVQSALGRKVKIGTNDDRDYDYFLIRGREDEESRRVENCNDYIKAKEKGRTASSNADMATESFFISACVPLTALNRSIVPKKDFLDVKNYPLLEKFPVFLLPDLSPEVQTKLLAESNRGKSLKDYLVSKKIKIKIKEKDKSINVIWDGYERYFDLVATGDFTGNGYVSMLLFIASYSRTGTYRYYQSILLTMRDYNQKMYDVHLENEGCLYEKGTYECSPEQKWSVIQQKEFPPPND